MWTSWQWFYRFHATFLFFFKSHTILSHTHHVSLSLSLSLTHTHTHTHTHTPSCLPLCHSMSVSLSLSHDIASPLWMKGVSPAALGEGAVAIVTEMGLHFIQAKRRDRDTHTHTHTYIHTYIQAESEGARERHTDLHSLPSSPGVSNSFWFRGHIQPIRSQVGRTSEICAGRDCWRGGGCWSRLLTGGGGCWSRLLIPIHYHNAAGS